MNLKEFLPFYIGCWYWTENSEGQLNSITLPNVEDMIDRGKKVRLHLRPIIDLKEKEIKEYNKKWNTLYTTADQQNQIRQEAACIKYLTSIHIDVFGLIEAGHAVDVTKINSY